MQDENFRHELKHRINMSDYFSLRSRLQAVAERDAHANERGEYKVRSLYFDNFEDKALREKIDGIDNREKFRLRLYNDDTEFMKLEKKTKRNGLCRKQSEPITKEQCRAVIEGSFDRILTDKPLIAELYTKMRTQQLRPKILVDYIREPFLFGSGNVRITIDRDIRSGLFSKDLLNPSTPMIPACDPGIMILEVKYDEFLPGIISDLIQTNGRQGAAYSKYAACRIYG